MFVNTRIGLDGRLVLVVAASGVVLKLFHNALAKARSIRDELLVLDAAWAVCMVLIMGWGIVCIRRGPASGRPSAWFSLVLCLASIAYVAVELIRYTVNPF